MAHSWTKRTQVVDSALKMVIVLSQVGIRYLGLKNESQVQANAIVNESFY